MDIDSMKISVTILPEKTKKSMDIPNGTLIIDMLRSLKLSPDSLIVLRNNQPIPIDEPITDEVPLSIFKVASGG